MPKPEFERIAQEIYDNCGTYERRDVKNIAASLRKLYVMGLRRGGSIGQVSANEEVSRIEQE